MMKKRTLIFIAIGFLAIAVLLICIFQNGQSNKGTDYEKALITYLEAMKEGPEKAIEYAAFPNEIIEYDYLHSPVKVADYEIVSSEKVNENLYAFTLNIALDSQPEVYTPLYYFVGYVDEEYVVYINATYVPEEISLNFDISEYSYSNPNYLESVPEFDN